MKITLTSDKLKLRDKTGILCHGRHVEAINWELHEWGDEKKGLIGQIPKTILLAYQEKPEIIVFGTGASQRDGIYEAEIIVKYMLENFSRLEKFPQFKGIKLSPLEKFMHARSIPETKSKNTLDEIRNAGNIFLKYNVEKAIIVSNPDHIARCMQIAHQAYQDDKIYSLKNIFAAQSEVCYDGTSKISTKPIEKTHRGDDPSPDLSSVIGNYYKITKDQKYECFNQLKKFFEGCLRK